MARSVHNAVQLLARPVMWDTLWLTTVTRAREVILRLLLWVVKPAVALMPTVQHAVMVERRRAPPATADITTAAANVPLARPSTHCAAHARAQQFVRLALRDMIRPQIVKIV